MQATSNGTAICDVQRTDTRACRAVPPAPRPAARKHASQPPTSAVRAARLPTHAEPRPQLIIPSHAHCCCCRSPLPPPPPLSPAAAVHCRRAAGRHRQRRPQLHAQPGPLATPTLPLFIATSSGARAQCRHRLCRRLVC